MKNLNPSTDPVLAIDAVAYEGQPMSRRMYKPGYEGYMAAIPALYDDSPNLASEVSVTKDVMEQLGRKLATEDWIYENQPTEEDFDRTILAIEDSTVAGEGAELIVARWGNGHTSPVHGHSTGFLYENILAGKMLVNTYIITDIDKATVRPIKTEIVESGVFLSEYTKVKTTFKLKRQTMVHNFKSIGNSVTLHFIPEHTRDGRDNKFNVEWFDVKHPLETSDIKQLTGKEAMYLPVGEVLLVRSENVPEYGDHYIVVTGRPIQKPHGLRPQDISIQAPHNTLLDRFEMQNGTTLLQLNPAKRDLFLQFHGIDRIYGGLNFPNP